MSQRERGGWEAGWVVGDVKVGVVTVGGGRLCGREDEGEKRKSG